MTETLPAAAHRALGALNDLIEYCNDPGVEAFGARFELAQALSGHPRPADDPTPLRERIRRAICEADGFDFDQIEASDYQAHADAMLALLPAAPSAPADQAAGVAEAIRNFPFDNFGMDDVSFVLEDEPEAQEWVPALADAVLATLPATTARAVELRDYWHGEAMSATTRIIELQGQLEELRRMADEAQQPACPAPESHNWGCGCPGDRLPLYSDRGVDTPGCDCGHNGMGMRWHDGSGCAWFKQLTEEGRRLLAADDGDEAQQPEAQAEIPAAVLHEDPARIDRMRPEFTEHASVESIDVQLRRARSQERRWHVRTEWLISLRAARVEQKARGEWPAAVSQPGKEA